MPFVSLPRKLVGNIVERSLSVESYAVSAFIGKYVNGKTVLNCKRNFWDLFGTNCGCHFFHCGGKEKERNWQQKVRECKCNLCFSPFCIFCPSQQDDQVISGPYCVKIIYLSGEQLNGRQDSWSSSCFSRDM